MPYKEKEIEKRYLTIGELAEELGEFTATVRLWVNELNIKVKRNRKGHRLFDKKAADKVRLAKEIMFLPNGKRRLTLEGAKYELGL